MAQVIGCASTDGQSQARDRWLTARRAELLATPYAHVVFTLPHQLAPLALQNKERSDLRSAVPLQR